MTTALWDFAGVDGLVVARLLCGEAAGRLSAYQSLEQPQELGDGGALLRLCEGNFRLHLRDPAALVAAARGRRVWAKPNPLAVLTAQDDVPRLRPFVHVKPPHRLDGLPPDHAAPARLNDQAVLLWRHRGLLEVQTAARDADAVRACLCQAGLIFSSRQ